MKTAVTGSALILTCLCALDWGRVVVVRKADWSGDLAAGRVGVGVQPVVHGVGSSAADAQEVQQALAGLPVIRALR